MVSHVSSGTIRPVASIASRPSSSGTNCGTASPLACSASATACTVGATISGPMPSPCHTPRRQVSVLAMPSTLGRTDQTSTGLAHCSCVLPEPDVRKSTQRAWCLLQGFGRKVPRVTDYSSHSAASEQSPADTAGSSSGVSFDKAKPSALTIILNAIRGGMIGLAELVPGVSGGTIALVTGVYERVLYNANVFLDGVKTLPKDRA